MKTILTSKEEDLFLDCTMLYGGHAQLEQYAEECMEGALAVRKFLRAFKAGDEKAIKKAHIDLLGEIADTTIMSKQAALILGDDPVTIIIDEKIDRQVKRVESAKIKNY